MTIVGVTGTLQAHKILENQFNTHNFIKHRIYRDCFRKRETLMLKIFSEKKEGEIEHRVFDLFY